MKPISDVALAKLPPTRTGSSTDPWRDNGMPERIIRTGRLVLAPYGWQDLSALAALKANPLVWAQMLGGVRSLAQTTEDLEGELRFWASHGVGMWTARDLTGRLLGVTGLHERPDARGIALRFAFHPECRGHGLAREAAGAVLQDAHAAGLTRVVAVTREDNFGSRRVLGGIGMVEEGRFTQNGRTKLLYASERRGPSRAAADW
jgi:RimJ/RimL family protein N-acetyltransferase